MLLLLPPLLLLLQTLAPASPLISPNQARSTLFVHHACT
jgi:hypothetical protein